MRNIKAVFDIGNDSIKAIVIGNDEGKEIILAKQIEQTQGLRKGKILDSEGFTNTINKILENFVKKLGGDFIEELFVSISHPELIINRVVEQKRVMRDEISEEDVDHLSRVITEISHKSNYETIKIVPVHRIIDETKREKDPIGMKGKKLELVADVFMIPKNLYNGLIDSFERIGVKITDIIPNIIAASEIALDYDHKDLGTILIDIGKNQTSYVIYEDGYTLGYGVVPMGGEDVTKDISIGMQIDIKEAENIKKTHGSAIVFKDNIKDDSGLDILFLSDIINARYEEIFNKINTHLHKLDKEGRLAGGVILIGGGSKIGNIDILAKDIFKLATFYGKDNVLNLGDISSNTLFTNVLGAYLRSNKYTEGRKMSFKLNFDIIGNIVKFFKDLF
ncbi:MAG: cell division protein FtsA [Candidatus Absconditabacteria bacterium]|nr:cell division protein FtsA [Candidatus Absconditabacteria bacterium]